MHRVLVTGSAGFIGYHLCTLLLNEGFEVHGYDGMTDYYDVRLKRRRQQMLLQNPGFAATEGMLEDSALLSKTIQTFKPVIVVHLAAQAGVRYSLENPASYISSNIVGTFNLMEAVKGLELKHLLVASTSAVYGANQKMPFVETDKADTPLSPYGATKKACEALVHTHAHLTKIPTTVFRFFTVYGPWGRPDMALFKFVDAILEGRPIDVYNHGKMRRDFTYVGDLVRGVRLLMEALPAQVERREDVLAIDSLSSAAPYRTVNIGNGSPVELSEFIDTIERVLGKKAIRNNMDLHKGDLLETWADCTLLEELTGFAPQTTVSEGVTRFVDWFLDYRQTSAVAA